MNQPIINLDARVLVVEDDLTTSRMLTRLLHRHGIHVHVAASGREALQILEREKDFEMVLSDWNMPAMSGIDLLAAIRESDQLRSMYFVMITAKDNLEDKINALNAGADDFLTKPFHHEELLARVRSGLRIRRLQAELLRMEKRMAILEVATAAGHEINNPLTGVIGFLDFLRDGLENGEDQQVLLGYLDRITMQAGRVRNIVSRLMNLDEVHEKTYIGHQRMLDLSVDSDSLSQVSAGRGVGVS